MPRYPWFAQGGVAIQALKSNDRALVFVVSGPSGSGKTSLCTEILKRHDWIRISVSHTTRPPREGEEDGKDYRFVSREEFMALVRKDQFLEWAEVHGYCYGSAADNLETSGQSQTLMFEVDCNGAGQIREKIPDAVLIFVMPSSVQDIVSRIQKRGGMDYEELLVRINTARNEILQADKFDCLVINDDFPEALEQFQSILVAERCRKELNSGGWVERWNREINVILDDLNKKGATR